jgi:transposase
MQAAPEPFLKAIAPDQEALVVCVACLFTWYGLADVCARESLPFVLGHALDMQALPGGNATHDSIDAPNIAVLLRGGLLPQASGSPAEMRATRDLRRRRRHFLRKRAAGRTHVQHTHRQSNLPAIGQKMAYQANRAGVAERLPDPAGPQSIAVDLALMGHDDQLLRDVERSILTTAQPHDANTLSLRRTVPGLGESLSLVLLDDIHDRQRFPRGQDVVSDCRLIKWAKASAGKRYGTAGSKMGNASLTGAFADAAVLV